MSAVSDKLCLSVPNADEIRHIALDYNGHGTQSNDVIVVLIVLVSLLLVALTTIGYFYFVRYKTNGQKGPWD